MEILGKRLNLIAHLTILYKLIFTSFMSSILPPSFLHSFFLRCYWGRHGGAGDKGGDPHDGARSEERGDGELAGHVPEE